ncbi:MAG: amino acid adenylation domain-containing protein [Roseateles sp.]|uniref:amino acid adenylation domain-containing protein n=1 Tax=Roseateles sp. TaxID=1971397 RepID=UPI0039E7B52E
MQINVAEYLFESARRWPNRLALEDERRAISFAQLVVAADRLARLLADRGVSPGDPIAVLVPKSAEAVVAIVASVFAGGVYIPLDGASPAERLRTIVGQIGDTVLICTETTYVLARDISGSEESVICIASDIEPDCTIQVVDQAIAAARHRLADRIDLDPCYVIFTSGSTGIPKGVTISHRSVIDYIEWARQSYPVDDTSRIASQAPFYFDNSTLDLYLSFATGASLHIPPDGLYAFPKLILDYLSAKAITTIFWVPSVLVAVANSGLLDKFPPTSVKHVLFAGEQMPVAQINAWVKALPGALFSNLYGPTEITVDCTAFTFHEPYAGDILPIGHACKNTDVILLDEHDQACAAGQIGELCVRGSSLALGYWNDPERSSTVFVQNPLQKRFRDLIYRTGDLVRRDETGCITFLGRKDSQIKHNGHRIELGEIEAAALKLAQVAQACILYPASLRQIVLFAVLKVDASSDIVQMRRELGQRIPKYMMPTIIRIVEELPLSANGKIDRLKLAASLN